MDALSWAPPAEPTTIAPADFMASTHFTRSASLSAETPSKTIFVPSGVTRPKATLTTRANLLLKSSGTLAGSLDGISQKPIDPSIAQVGT